MDGIAVVFSFGRLATSDAKTAHGLIRGSERYRVAAIVDEVSAGRDAGEVLDGKARGILVVASLAEALHLAPDVTHAIVGIATPGGKVTPDVEAVAAEALDHGLHVVCGLHGFLSEKQTLAARAQKNGVALIDVRKPAPRETLHFWTGAIERVACPKLVVMGTDCSIGKRTTARLITQTAREKGLAAHMIYTGQTGWMQGGRYGFVLDSIYNDFVAGELEHAIVSCFEAEAPDLIVVEGQAALRNPSGPCGSEFLVSGRMDGVILQHDPVRRHYHGFAHWGEIPPIESEIALIEAYGAPVLAVTLNNGGLEHDELRRRRDALQVRIGLPVVLPLEDGVASIVDDITARFSK